MAVSVSEFKEWVNTLDDNAMVAVDDGGLIITVSDTAGQFPGDPTEGCYFEIGGVPLDEIEPEET